LQSGSGFRILNAHTCRCQITNLAGRTDKDKHWQFFFLVAYPPGTSNKISPEKCKKKMFVFEKNDYICRKKSLKDVAYDDKGSN